MERSAGADSVVAERLGEEALAQPHRIDEQHLFAAVERDLGGPVEILQPADLFETGLSQAQCEPPVVAAADRVGQDVLQEVEVAELFAAGQGDPFRQGVKDGAQLEPLEQRL